MKTRKREKHPFGIIAIIFLQIFYMLVNIVQVVNLYRLQAPDMNQLLTESRFLVADMSLLFSLFGIFIVYGLWRMKSWAWALLMIQIGITLLILLYSYYNGEPRYLKMALNVVMALYLNQRDIRQRFEDKVGQPV